MTPSIVPLVSIDLDRRRSIRLDMAAILRSERELCALWGKKQNILTILFDSDSLTINDIVVILWQGLLHEDPALTLEQVQNMVNMTNLAQVTESIFDAWSRATAPVEGSAPQESANGPLALGSTGVPSGVTPASTSPLTTPPSGA